MKHGLTYLLAIIIVAACVKVEPVSPIPQITYKSIEVGYFYDTLDNLKPAAILEFDFIDGDADFGLIEENTEEFSWNDRYFNIFLIHYYKSDNEYLKVEYDTNTALPPWYGISQVNQLDRTGQNRTIQGTITIENIDIPSDYDTIRIEFFIRDRAGNDSNTEITDAIPTKPSEK